MTQGKRPFALSHVYIALDCVDAAGATDGTVLADLNPVMMKFTFSELSKTKDFWGETQWAPYSAFTSESL